jgi:hypothetical protein
MRAPDFLVETFGKRKKDKRIRNDGQKVVKRIRMDW